MVLKGLIEFRFGMGLSLSFGQIWNWLRCLNLEGLDGLGIVSVFRFCFCLSWGLVWMFVMLV